MMAALAETLISIQIGQITDEILPLHKKIELLYGFRFLVLLAVIDLIMNFSMRFFVVRFAQSVIFDLRQDIFIALQSQELEFYSNENVGQIMARSIEEIYSLRDLLTWSLRISFLLLFLFLTAIYSMSRISHKLTLIFVAMPITIIIIIAWYSKRNQALFYNARYKFGILSDTLAQNLSGIQTVKSFGREEEQKEIFNVKNQDYFYASMKTANVRATIIPGMVVIIGSSLVLLLFIGGGLLLSQQITVGNFITFMLLSLNIAVPGRFMGWIGIVAQDANSAAIRLNEIFKAPVAIENSINSNHVEKLSGDIEFKKVSFGFPEENHILYNIDLKIPAGQKVALLGGTGAGKSTLINLIPRFYDPTLGDIFIDNMNIKEEFTLESLRKHIGIVHQEAFLFTLSLHDNIAFGKPDAKRKDVIEAAKAAQIHDFIMTLEENYDTIVGERGVTLSGGQRQRVTIARTILSDPEILIFDDSVSAVDPETESKIQETLEKASDTRTTIVISQRPSSLKYVDRILVIDEGRIVQDGKHQDLMKIDGIYRRFIDTVASQVKFMDWDSEIMEEML